MIRFHLHVVAVQFQRLGLLRHTGHTVLQVDHLQCGPPPPGGGQTGWGTDGGHPTGTPEDVRQSKARMHESDVRRGTFTSITSSAWTGSHASLNQKVTSDLIELKSPKLHYI